MRPTVGPQDSRSAGPGQAVFIILSPRLQAAPSRPPCARWLLASMRLSSLCPAQGRTGEQPFRVHLETTTFPSPYGARRLGRKRDSSGATTESSRLNPAFSAVSAAAAPGHCDSDAVRSHLSPMTLKRHSRLSESLPHPSPCPSECPCTELGSEESSQTAPSM